MQTGALLFLSFLLLQRVSELAISKVNTKRLLACGAYEVGAGHYPAMVTMHSAWLVCLSVFGYSQPVSIFWIVLFATLQIFRIWILTSLGFRWTTRIIILEEPLVKHGPFKFIHHPNYTLVVAEIIVAPMVLGLWWIAILFTILNALMLWVRITAEESALSPLRNKL